MLGMGKVFPKGCMFVQEVLEEDEPSEYSSYVREEVLKREGDSALEEMLQGGGEWACASCAEESCIARQEEGDLLLSSDE